MQFQNPVCSLNNAWGKTSKLFLKMMKSTIAVSGNNQSLTAKRPNEALESVFSSIL